MKPGINLKKDNKLKGNGFTDKSLDKPSSYFDNSLKPLKIFVLGRFAIVLNNKPILFTTKSQRKPLLMIKALLAYGGRDVREEVISDAIWPEIDGDIAHRSFTVTLHRLRKFIGNHNYFLLRDKRLTLNPKCCWVDIWEFERIIGRADFFWQYNETEKAILKYKKAVGIYKGAFLAGDVEKQWTNSFRERSQSKFLRSVENIGRYLETNDQQETAIEYYKRGLEVDDLAEFFYIRLMTCYFRLNRNAEALSVYNRCRRIFSDKYGIKPSRELTAIHQLIIQ